MRQLRKDHSKVRESSSNKEWKAFASTPTDSSSSFPLDTINIAPKAVEIEKVHCSSGDSIVLIYIKEWSRPISFYLTS